MIKEIVKDNFILAQKSTDASNDDLYIVDDLIDTIQENKERCVGMAANMIGYLKNIIIFQENNAYTVMINPHIIQTSKETYQTKEGCLSHDGQKDVVRYQKIKIEYLDIDMKKRIKTYSDYTAQIIQHEIDHCNGILI
ncbi:MAG: peptide deformylase [Coprobacillus sp.]